MPGIDERWPASLHPKVLADLGAATPFLALDPAIVVSQVQTWCKELAQVKPFYAVKCNSDPAILAAIAGAGASFEVAGAQELAMVMAVGVDPSGVLYSNPVKPAAHIEATFAAGLWRFAVDTTDELAKVARHAPGSAVYVRVSVDDSSSAFPLGSKFGTSPQQAVALLVQARDLGLIPYGLTFHVGSQALDPSTWTRACSVIAAVMDQLSEVDITITMLDIGGGMPTWYGQDVPGMAVLASAITAGIELLPYTPELLVAEPGRFLVSDSCIFVASVIGRSHRAGRDWLYLDISAFHGLLDTLQITVAGGWPYPLATSRDGGDGQLIPYMVTGPTCDSADTMFSGAMLPADLAEGDKVFIGSAGAYTMAYSTSFNGFPPPVTVLV